MCYARKWQYWEQMCVIIIDSATKRITTTAAATAGVAAAAASISYYVALVVSVAYVRCFLYHVFSQIYLICQLTRNRNGRYL